MRTDPGASARVAIPGSSGLLLPALGLLLVLGACEDEGRPPEPASASGATVDTVVDAEGRTVALPASPRRVVSLVPSATRTLTELGAADRLVGRTSYDTAAALADLPSVGGGLHPSVEALLALDPDLVIRFAGASDSDTPRRLDALGIPHLAVRPESVDEVRGMIGTLGRVVGRPGAAGEMLARIDSALAGIRREAARHAPVAAAFLVGGDPPWVAGPGTYVHELVELAGGRNVFGDLDRPWAGVSPETLVDRSPEILLVVEGVSLDPRLVGEATVRRLSPAVQLPGPDLIRAAREVARALHPEPGPP